MTPPPPRRKYRRTDASAVKHVIRKFGTNLLPMAAAGSDAVMSMRPQSELFCRQPDLAPAGAMLSFGSMNSRCTAAMKVFPATAAGVLLLAMLALGVGPSTIPASHLVLAVVVLVCLALGYKLATKVYRLRVENDAGRAEVERLKVENEADRAERDRLRMENKAGRAEVGKVLGELEAAMRDLERAKKQLVSLMKHKDADVAAAAVKVDAATKQATEAEQRSEVVSAKHALFSLDPNQQYAATQWLRKRLSVDNPPIEEVTSWMSKHNIMPQLIKFLKRADMPQLQFETAWVLTNVTSGTTEHTNLVVDAGAVPIFVQLLESPSDDVREQAIWALANIAGESPQCRDVVLNAGALPSLLKQLKQDSKPSVLRVAARMLANLCGGKPRANFQVTCDALPTLARFIHSADEDVVVQACWALFWLSHGTGDRFAPDSQCIDKFIEAGVVCRRLMTLLAHPKPIVLDAVLRIVGNIVTGDDMQTQMVIDCGALPSLLTLLTANRRIEIKQEACWTVSNILAGAQHQKQAVIDANIIQPMVALLQNAEFAVKKEAAWAVCNAAWRGTAEQVQYLADAGAIKPLCNILTTPDPKQGVGHVRAALEGLANILKVGEQMQRTPGSNNTITFAQLVRDADGLNKIESLQEHPNDNLHKMVVSILETYFENREGDGQNVTH